ncbi:hypothetical protein [Streptosporangium sp. NPDC001681]|uniref:hypothetical protein n=1 Tax=Streptosporangium sp. NPDC001681 TaxID=3154395 RepID=UPI003319635E
MAKKRRRPGEVQMDLFSEVQEEATPPKKPAGLAMAVATPQSVAPPPICETPPTLNTEPVSPPEKSTPRPRPRITPVSPGKLAERVEEAWYSHYGGHDIDIPVGVVAALTLVRQGRPDRAVPGAADPRPRRA